MKTLREQLVEAGFEIESASPEYSVGYYSEPKIGARVEKSSGSTGFAMRGNLQIIIKEAIRTSNDYPGAKFFGLFKHGRDDFGGGRVAKFQSFYDLLGNKVQETVE